MRKLVDLNTPELIRPISVSKEKSLCGFCCACGPVVVSTSLERRGYSVGNAIVLSVDCTHKRITYLSATLTQKVEYHAESQIKPVHKVISSVVVNDWTAGSIHIPPTIIPTITDCTVIRVTYEVLAVLKFKIPGVSDLFLPPMPVTIGNVSSTDIQPALTNTNINQVRNSVMAQDPATFTNFSVQPSAPPASFCIRDDADIQLPSVATNFSLQYMQPAGNVMQPTNSNSVTQLSESALIPNTPPPSYTESMTLQNPHSNFNLPTEQYSQ